MPTACRCDEYIDLPRGRARGQDAVRLVDRRRQAADQDGGVGTPSSIWSRSAASTGAPCSTWPASDVAKLDADHRAELEALQAQYEEAAEAARSLARRHRPRRCRELAASSKAPAVAAASRGARCRRRRLRRRAGGAGGGERPTAPAARHLAEDDLAKCTNCKTCYQDLSELFEKTTHRRRRRGQGGRPDDPGRARHASR